MTIDEHIRDAAADIARLRPSDPKGIEAVLRVLVKHERELCAQMADAKAEAVLDYIHDGGCSASFTELAALIRTR